MAFAPHLRRQVVDFRQVALHLAPPVPKGIVRASVIRSLERPHPVLEEHDKEFLFDDRRSVVEGQQVGERVGIILRLCQNSISVESGDGPDCLSHKVIGILDHVVAVLRLLGRKVGGMALIAGLHHLVALCLPGRLIHACDVGGLNYIEASCGLTLRIEHPQSLQDRYLVGLPLRVVG